MAFSCFKACMGGGKEDGVAVKEHQHKSAHTLSHSPRGIPSKIQTGPTVCLPCHPSSPQPDYTITCVAETAEAEIETDSIQTQVLVDNQPITCHNVSAAETAEFPELTVVDSYVTMREVDEGNLLDGSRGVVPVIGPASAASASLADMSSSNTEERLMPSSSTTHNPELQLPFRPRRIRTAVSQPEHEQSPLPTQSTIDNLVRSRWSDTRDIPSDDSFDPPTNTEALSVPSSSTSHNPEWELPFRPRRIRTAVSQLDRDQTQLPPQLSVNSMVGSRWSVMTDTPGEDYPLPSDDASNPFGNIRNQDLGARSSFDSDVGTPRGSDSNTTQFTTQPSNHVHFSESVAVQSQPNLDNATASFDSPQLSSADSAASVVLSRRFSAATNVPSRLSRASMGEFSNANTGSLSTATSHAFGRQQSSASERTSASSADRSSGGTPPVAMIQSRMDQLLSPNVMHNTSQHLLRQVIEESGEDSQLLSTLPEHHRTSEASWGTSTRSFAAGHDTADPSRSLTRTGSKSNSGDEN